MSSELLFVNLSILQSLHLNTSNGLSYERTYSFRFPLQNLTHSQSDYNHYNIRDLLLEYGRPSILKNKKLIKCKDTFLAFLDRRKLPKSTFKTLLYMAYRYHQATFNLAEISHKFLILMVIFESLFKRKTEKASQAAKRISKLISKVQSNQKQIQKSFFDNKPDCFCNIRNNIAHGDPSLDTRMVKSKYPLLYKYITKAIIKLVEIPSGEIDPTKNYYHEVDKYINSYFSTLPSS